MNTSLGNIYKMARKASSLTQETAAEYLNISTETLSKYENSKVIPTDKMVARMAHVYDFPRLAVQHLESHNELAHIVLPEIRISRFGLSVLNMETVLDELQECRPRLKSIARNDKVTDDEWEDWVNTVDKLMEAAGALIGVIHSVKGDE